MGWWHLTWKDLRLHCRDKRSLAILLVLPMIFISIIGLSTGKLLGWRASNQVIQIAWVDLDGGEVAKRVQEKLVEKEDVQVIPYSNTETAKREIFSGNATMSFTIGPEFQKRIDELELRDFFTRKLGKGRLAEGLKSLDVAVETKGSWRWVSKLITSNVYSMILDDVFPTVAKRHNLGRMLIRNMEAAAAEEEADSTENPATDPNAEVASDSITSDQHQKTTPKTNGKAEETAPQASVAEGSSAREAIYNQLVPGFTVMFTFFLINVMGRSFIAERDIGTLRRLRISPLTSGGLLVGKTLPYFLISLLQSAALFLSGRLLYGMSWGQHPVLLLPIIFCTSIAATCLGLVVGTTVRTDAQVSSYSNLIVISLAGISGCFMPRDWMPDLMKRISVVTPHTWSLIGYDEVLTKAQPEIAVIVKCCLLLLGFSVAFFAVGCWRFRSLS